MDGYEAAEEILVTRVDIFNMNLLSCTYLLYGVRFL